MSFAAGGTKWRDANIGIATGAVSRLVVVDVDGSDAECAIAPYLAAVTGPLFVVRTGRGRHLYFAEPATPLGNRANVLPHVDVRGTGGYVIGAPRVHVTGPVYETDDLLAPLPIIPDPLFALLAPSSASPALANGEGSLWTPALHGPDEIDRRVRGYMATLPTGMHDGDGRDNVAYQLATFVGRDLGQPFDVALEFLKEWDRGNAEPLGDALLEVKLTSALNSKSPTARAIGSGLDRPMVPRPIVSDTPTAADDDGRGDEDVGLVPWPADLADVAYRGIAGEFVRVVGDATEADASAVLVQFLVAAGNLMGRHHYVTLDVAEHYSNLNVVLVGSTSLGRKGTAWSVVRALLKAVEPEFDRRVVSGFQSGEGLIHQVRDAEWGVDKNGMPTLIDEGVEDKRCLIVESEFGRMLRTMAKDGSTLSPVFRLAFDTGTLNIPAKTTRNKATGAHLSMVGHVTKAELRRRLEADEIENGFANRMLWWASRRSKVLPRGGAIDVDRFKTVVADLGIALRLATAQEEMAFSVTGAACFDAMYREDFGIEVSGRLDDLTARGSAIIARLALIYALLDLAQSIGPEHVEAARAVWDRSVATVAYILGASLTDPLVGRLIEVFRTRGEGRVFRTAELYNALGHSVTRNKLHDALELLEDREMIRHDTVHGRGRPVHQFWWVGRA